MKSYFLLLRLNLRNLLAGFRGAMRKPNGKIDISRLILYPLALLGMRRWPDSSFSWSSACSVRLKC